MRAGGRKAGGGGLLARSKASQLRAVSLAARSYAAPSLPPACSRQEPHTQATVLTPPQFIPHHEVKRATPQQAARTSATVPLLESTDVDRRAPFVTRGRCGRTTRRIRSGDCDRGGRGPSGRSKGPKALECLDGLIRTGGRKAGGGVGPRSERDCPQSRCLRTSEEPAAPSLSPARSHEPRSASLPFVQRTVTRRMRSPGMIRSTTSIPEVTIPNAV